MYKEPFLTLKQGQQDPIMMLDDELTQAAREGVSISHGSLERLAENAQLQANKTMFMWRPNLSQIAREEVSKLGDSSPQEKFALLNKLRKVKAQLPQVHQKAGETFMNNVVLLKPSLSPDRDSYQTID